MAAFELHCGLMDVVTMHSVNMVRGVYPLRRGCSIAGTLIAPGESFHTVHFISRSTSKLRGSWSGIAKQEKGDASPQDALWKLPHCQCLGAIYLRVLYHFIYKRGRQHKGNSRWP